MKKSVGVLRFLGTNCDRDVFAAADELGLKPEWLWFADRFDPAAYDGFLVPGGFSHGDYLRCGALAAKAPAMSSLREAANAGRPVVGICNGFQILCEAQLLPGALVRNENRRFVDKWVDLDFGTRRARLPIAHGEGRYYLEREDLARLRDRGQIWCTYAGENPNGSIGDVAGVSNEAGNVRGLMPHPERALAAWMGGDDGRAILAAGWGG